MPRRIAFTRWESVDDWAAGTGDGAFATHRGLAIADPVGTRELDGVTYEHAAWTSPWQQPGFVVADVVTSWSALTIPGGWLEISAQADGSDTWGVLGRWAGDHRPSYRTSVSGQPDVDTDVWRPRGARAWRLRLTLLRTPGGPGPTVRMAAAVSSDGADNEPSTSARGSSVGSVLDVPCFSQMAHRDHGGGGWCSPTAVAMVLARYRALPRLRGSEHQDPCVDHVAKEVFDAAYDGAGNWSFNAAYAAGQAGDAFVTRLHDLRDAEAFVTAGIPLVAAVKYADGALAGAPVPATEGHLLVICGFTEGGDVVVNDPAGATNGEVRRTYDRGELERAWLGGSGGIVYVIRDDAHPLPPRTEHSTW
ncbi:MAG: C39 family peptidase [Nocardioides sp.]